MLSSPNPLCFSCWSLSESHPQNSPSGLCSLLAALWRYKWLWSQASLVNKLFFDTCLHNKPLIKSFIWEWASPFSRFWTTVFAILVRWPMFPLLLPPSALKIKVEKLQSANSRNKHTEDMMDIKMSFMGQSHNDNKEIRGTYWILSFSSQASRILCTSRQCWKSWGNQITRHWE